MKRFSVGLGLVAVIAVGPTRAVAQLTSGDVAFFIGSTVASEVTRGQVLRGPPGPMVELPMEITDAPIQRDSGEMSRGQIIGHHTFRAMDAVVLLEPIQGRNGEIPAGSVLTGVLLHDGDTTKPVYCDLHISPDHRQQYLWSCFTDSNGSGKLDDFWVGRATDAFLGFATDPYDLDWKRKLAAPAGYRKATEVERPMGMIGYSWCGGDNVTGPARFTLAASWPNGFWEMAEAVSCSFGRWTGPASHDRVDVDRITVALKPGAQPNTLAFKVETRIPPEIIAPIHPNQGVRPLSEESAIAAKDIKQLQRPPFIRAGARPTPVTGTVGGGDVFFSTGANHALTGVLTNEVQIGRYALLAGAAAKPGDSLQPGQIVYGAKAGGIIKPQIVWCAPQKNAAGEWIDAICLPKTERGTVMIHAKPVMMGVANLTSPQLEQPFADEPMVDRRPVDLPPMVLSYVFKGWEQHAARVELRLDWGAGPKYIEQRTWPTDSSGVAHIPVIGGEILLSRAAQANEAIVGGFTAMPPTADEAGG